MYKLTSAPGGVKVVRTKLGGGGGLQKSETIVKKRKNEDSHFSKNQEVRRSFIIILIAIRSILQRTFLLLALGICVILK